MNEIEKIFKQKADYYDSTLMKFNDFRLISYGTDSHLLKWFCDYCIFTVMVLFDLWIILCDYQRATKKYQQNYYARQTSLLCFELLSDIPNQMGSEYNHLFQKLIINDEINNKSHEIRKTFNILKNKYETHFKDIRDITAAHREHNITKQLLIINEMDNEWIMSFSLEFMKEIESLNRLMNDVITIIYNDINTMDKKELLKKYDYVGKKTNCKKPNYGT